MQPASVQQHLRLWSPNSRQAHPEYSLEEARQYCRRLATSHYENFTVVSFLLPREIRQHFYNVYAYCRWSDDLADELSSREESLEMLDWWQSELAACYSGSPSHPVLVALAETIRVFSIPQQPFEDLLSAFRQDQKTTRYQTASQVEDYCQRSANPVGRIILYMARSVDAPRFEWSDHICTGLQIANFCQDMAIDAGKGRIYAPQDMWSVHQVDEAMILRSMVTPELKSLLRQWVEIAEGYFQRGEGLVELVPNWLKLDIELFSAGGMGILQAIKKNDYDVWSRRVSLSRREKVALMLRAALRKWFPWMDRKPL